MAFLLRYGAATVLLRATLSMIGVFAPVSSDTLHSYLLWAIASLLFADAHEKVMASRKKGP